MNPRSEELIAAHREGRLIEVAYEMSLGGNETRQSVSDLLVELHNKKDIDLIEAFLGLRNNMQNGPDFFLSRHLFENALPTLSAPVQQVMTCVQHLAREAGNDLVANTVFGAFINFLVADPSRPFQALEVIRTSPNDWANFVCPTILAGTRINLEEHFGYAVELVSHEAPDISRNAIYSLGRISYPDGSPYLKRAIEEVARIADQKDDDSYMAVVVRTASSLARSDASLVEKAYSAISIALGKGSDLTLHAASEEFGFHAKDMPDQLLNLLISNLRRIKAENRGSIDNIDLGISALLSKNDKTQGIECLESILLANADTLNLKVFDGAIHIILTGDSTTINKLLTRWFLTADRTLCTGIREIVESVYENQLPVEVAIEDLPNKDPATLIFIARKAIGYLFFKPLSVASIIISLIRLAEEKTLMEELGRLLLDPVLLNYPGSTREFLETQIPKETELVAETIKSALNSLDEYMKELRDIGTIPELHPTLEQREAYSRNFNKKMSESYKEAMKGSIVELIATKSVLLYGRSSINYVRHGHAGPSRMEIPMQKHSVEMEFPRRHNLDPFGLDYMLRVFRTERMVEQR